MKQLMIMRRWCSSSARALSDQEVKELKRDITSRVGKTVAASWMPEFAFTFVTECMLEDAVKKVHVQRGLEADDPVLGLNIAVVKEEDWAPQKAANVLPFRETKLRNTHDMFNQLRSEINWSPERLWGLHKGTPERKYVKIASAGYFPVSEQPPTAWEGPSEANLFIDPDDTGVPKVYIQLCEQLPPLLWIPVQPKPYAVQRVLREVKQRMAEHATESREFWEERMRKGENLIIDNTDFHEGGRPALESSDQWERAMNLTAVNALLPNGEMIPGCPGRSATVYLGPWVSGDSMWEDTQAVNPLLHAWPAYRTHTGGHLISETVARKYQQGSEAGGLDKSVWVTRFSKSVIVFHHRFDISFINQMQWAEGCAHASRTLDKGVLDHQHISAFPTFDRVKPHPDMGRHHQFATIYYPKTQMLHGGKVIKKFNEVLQCELPEDVPVDVAGALMCWRNQGEEILLRDIEQKEIVTRDLPIKNHQELIVDLANPWNLYAESIVKLAVVGSKNLGFLLKRLQKHSSPAVRWAVAKSAALILRQV
eukprot:TRINITY_DN2084_c0_g1_i2.p1 TRINITY_DN2084_c0_g1~~TRINITY_DN2084_c0_g1_i2.p1  ORF type:complete len:537 (+),score=110.85 TRINITY_DN2084_c0_g1_i2:60-1670(+)